MSIIPGTKGCCQGGSFTTTGQGGVSCVSSACSGSAKKTWAGIPRDYREIHREADGAREVDTAGDEATTDAHSAEKHRL